MKDAPAPRTEIRRLSKLHELRLLDTDSERAYDDLVLLASVICDTPIALVSLIDEGRQWFKARVGLDAPETPRNISFCSHAILQDELFVVEDTLEDERFHDNPLVTGEPNIRFYAGVPLILEPGVNLGTLCVIDRQPRRLTPSQRVALTALSAQIVDQFRLRQQLLEREALDHAKDEFLAHVSHELRTPLTSIIGALGLATHEGADGEHLGMMIDIANRNAGLLLSTVNDILDLTKLEAGKVTLNTETLSLRNLVQEAINLSTGYFERCGNKVQLDPDDTSGRAAVFGDKKLLLQVITNLLSNAAKFSPSDSLVRVRIESREAGFRVSVIDEGPGLSKAQQQELFTKFPAIEGALTAKLPGTGLGLAISRRIIDAHNGLIGVESSPGEGARFFFTLPPASTEADEA